jgi:hypothetical protein
MRSTPETMARIAMMILNPENVKLKSGMIPVKISQTASNRIPKLFGILTVFMRLRNMFLLSFACGTSS